MKKNDPLERIADALEWRNLWDWWRDQRDSGTVSAFDGTDPPPPPPPPSR